VILNIIKNIKKIIESYRNMFYAYRFHLYYRIIYSDFELKIALFDSKTHISLRIPDFGDPAPRISILKISIGIYY